MVEQSNEMIYSAGFLFGYTQRYFHRLLIIL